MPLSPPATPSALANGTATDPTFEVMVDGTPIDHVAANILFGDLVTYSTGSDAALDFAVLGGPLEALPDDFLGHIVQLNADWGSGEFVLFWGRAVAVGYVFTSEGWRPHYTCKGATYLGSRVPHTHPSDGTDLCVFNPDPANVQNYDGSRAGRSIGAIIRTILDAEANATGLVGYAIGNYVTVGIGATATATLGGGGSVTVVVGTGGSGYGTGGNLPRVVLVGGGGTYSGATASVAAGIVTAVTVTGSTGYTTPPEVWISPLPLLTLNDLAALTLVPQRPVYVQGEKITDVVENLLREFAPNVFLRIDPNAANTLRFIDLRNFTGPTTFVLDSATDRIDLPSLQLTRSIEDCFPRVRIRGGPDVAAISVETRPPDGSAAPDGGLAEDFGHDGLNNADAKLYWKLNDYTQPTESGRATFTAGIGGGALTSLTNTFKGFGYAASTTYNLSFSGGGGSGATGTFTTNAAGQYTSHSITAGGTGYTTAPTVTAPPPPNANRDEGTCTCTSTTEIEVTSADVKKNWPTNYWDQSSTGRHGTIFITYDIGANIHAQFSARIIACDALTAGGSATVTIEGVLPITDYNYYIIVGTAGGAADVYRKYKTTNTAYNGKLLNRFPRPVAELSSDGQAGTLTNVPTMRILWSNNNTKPFQEAVMGVDVDSATTRLRAERPTVVPFGTHSKLVEGGTAVDGIPSSVRVMLAVNKGNLTATAPPDSGGSPVYGGTSNTVEGLVETLTVTCPEWIDSVQNPHMGDYASDLLDVHKDTTIEGSITLLRFNGPLLLTFGQNVRLDASYSLPWDGIDLPVVEARLTWVRGGGVKYRTSLRISNRRAALSAEHFARPQRTGFLLGGGLEGLGFAGEMSPIYTGTAQGAEAMTTLQGGHIGGAAESAFLGGAAQGGQNWLGGAAQGSSNWLGGAAQGASNLLGGAAQGASNWLNLASSGPMLNAQPVGGRGGPSALIPLAGSGAVPDATAAPPPPAPAAEPEAGMTPESAADQLRVSDTNPVGGNAGSGTGRPRRPGDDLPFV